MKGLSDYIYHLSCLRTVTVAQYHTLDLMRLPVCIICLAASTFTSVAHLPSRTKLLCWCVTQSGDSCRRACLGWLLHQVSLSWRSGCRLLGRKPSCHLFSPQKLYTRATIHPAKLILSVSGEPSGILKYTVLDGWSAIHHQSLLTCCTLLFLWKCQCSSQT